MRSTTEFSRPFEIAELAKAALPFEIEATPDERAAVARRLELLELPELRAQGRVEAAGGGVVRVRGRVVAQLVQRCVVTLEPVENRVESDFERLFLRSGGTASTLVEVAAEEVDIEPLLGDILDLGEIVTEELALVMDPYPRAPHASEYLEAYTREQDREPPASPLAALLGRRHGD